ncbi:MAG: tetratricopeptide repeat protein [Candidatus Poribacteria bacterium]|nr:tetratricopeptide repeat protein [Candidatus Poribacteria bacterium]
MKYSLKSLLIGLITLTFILSCAQAPQQVAENTLAPTENLAIKKAEGSTVLLVSRNGKSEPLGSGFFVDKDKIATNIHVVAQPGPIFAKLSDKEQTISIEGVVAYDVKNNLVILKLSGEGIPLPLGDSDTIQRGDSVFIVGYPYGKYNVTKRSIDSIHKSNKWFWMKAFTAKGVSGGAALNAKGEVTGVYVGYGNDSHSYIIPSNILKALLTKSALIESLVEWRKRESIRSYAYFVQGYRKYEADHYDEAISDLNRVIQLTPEFPAAYFKRALVYAERKDYEKAIVDYTKVIELNPEDTIAYQKRGRVKRRLGSSKSDIVQKLDLFSAAIDDYTHAIRLYPQYVIAYNNRGWVKYLIGKYGADVTKARQLYESAIDDYTQAIKIDPKYMPAHKNRGRAKAAVGDIESANGNPKAARILYKEGIAEYYKSADVGLQKTQLESVKGRESTVRVMCWAGTSSGFSYGSGFFVDYNKIVTNIHVVDKSGPVFVKLLDENTIWAVEGVIAFDVENDLVVLKIEGEGSPLILGDSDVVEIGESVISVGYPGRRYEVLAGTVHGTKNGGKLLLTTIDSSPGSSGGPVLNSKNEVVGIHVRSDNFTSSAIPSNALKHLLNQSELMEPLEEWQKLDSILAYVYFGKGKNRSNAKEYKQAIIDFNKAIQLNPEYTRAYFERGFAKYKIRDYIGSIDDYTQAIKFNPQYAMAYSNRGNRIRSLATSKADQGNIAEAHEMYEAAIEDYTRAIQSYPKYAKAYNNMGRCRYFFGKSKEDQGNVAEAQRLYEAAIDDYTHAININPEYTTAYFNRGIQRRRLGASKADQGNITEAQQLYQAAIDDYTQAIEIDPKHVLAHYNRGNAKKALGQHEAAEKDFVKAKELESK